jgi:hypothetical protein
VIWWLQNVSHQSRFSSSEASSFSSNCETSSLVSCTFNTIPCIRERRDCVEGDSNSISSEWFDVMHAMRSKVGSESVHCPLLQTQNLKGTSHRWKAFVTATLFSAWHWRVEAKAARKRATPWLMFLLSCSNLTRVMRTSSKSFLPRQQ